jgi:hypothetical protein
VDVAGECSLAVLGETLPGSLIEETLQAEGVVPQRMRKLPPDLVAWLVVAMGLYRSLSITNVLRRVVDGLTGFVRFGVAELPCATSISHARDRLGWKAVRALFQRHVEPMLLEHQRATTWRGLQLYTLDGMCARMPDTKANDAGFGRPGASRGGKSGFPQFRSLLLVAAWTHLIATAVVGPYTTGELTLAAELLPLIPTGALLLMDRGYYSFAWLASLTAKAQPFVVRAKTKGRTLRMKKGRVLGRGDRLARLLAPESLAKKRPDLPSTIDVRLVNATRKGFRARLLVTNLLDTACYPAAEVAALYDDRWEAELTNRELKVYQSGKGLMVRSHTPDRVRQEFFGHLIAYNAVRSLMAVAAEEAGVAPRELSFTDCLERIRGALPTIALVSGGDRDSLLAALVTELGQCLLQPRRVGRRCPRAIKIKMSKWPRKRPGTKVVARSRSTR